MTRAKVLLILILGLFVAPPVIAEVRSEINTSVSTGGQVELKVENKVESTNSETKVYKRVETNINGEKKVYESTEPGKMEIKLEISSSPRPLPSLSIVSKGLKMSKKPKKTELHLTLKQIIWERAQGLVYKFFPFLFRQTKHQ